MNRPTKTLIGLFTLIPYTFLGLMFISFLTFPQEIFVPEVLVAVRVGTLLWVGTLLVFYLRHLFQSKSLDGERRILWGAVLVVGNIFVMPIYWYKYIWHQNNQPRIMRNDDGTQIIGL